MMIENFYYDSVGLAVDFIETTQIAKGVKCDVYRFIGSRIKDSKMIKNLRAKLGIPDDSLAGV
jgi:hypothetical protein